MATEDGRELYLINRDTPLERIRQHEWLNANVVPHLPVALVSGSMETRHLAWNWSHPDADKIVSLRDMAAAVREFIQFRGEGHAADCLLPSQEHSTCPANEVALTGEQPEPFNELWGWYPAYDHVALSQLWGPMVKRPPHIPMQTFDVYQEAVRLGDPDLSTGKIGIPPWTGPEHHALADARMCKFQHEYLIRYEQSLRTVNEH